MTPNKALQRTAAPLGGRAVLPTARERLLVCLWGGVGTQATSSALRVFLAAPASDYITGQTIVVDSGFLTA